MAANRGPEFSVEVDGRQVVLGADGVDLSLRTNEQLDLICVESLVLRLPTSRRGVYTTVEVQGLMFLAQAVRAGALPEGKSQFIEEASG